jgi:hypothetical protein
MGCPACVGPSDEKRKKAALAILDALYPPAP